MLRGNGLTPMHTEQLVAYMQQQRLLRSHASFSEPRQSGKEVAGRAQHAFAELEPCLELITTTRRSHALFLVAVCRALSWLHCNDFRAQHSPPPHQQHPPQHLLLLHQPPPSPASRPRPNNPAAPGSRAAGAGAAHVAVVRPACFALHVAQAHVTVVDAPGAVLTAVTDAIQDAVDAVAARCGSDDVQVTHRTHEPSIDVYDLTHLGLRARTNHPAPKLLAPIQAALGARGWSCRSAQVLSGVDDCTCYLFTPL